MGMQQTSGDTHPIDQLGTALMRATGVLSALTACQDQTRGTFAVGEPFVLQAVAALEGFINEARNAYFELCAASEIDQRKVPVSTDIQSAQVADDVPDRRHGFAEDQRPRYRADVADQSLFQPTEEVSGLLPDFYELRRRTGLPMQPAAPSPVADAGEFAQSYEGLLRKLTAAEVFAAEKAFGDEDSDSPLLPLLKSLRFDLERLRAA